MMITPKNWNTFQHYKDRAPAWIKLHRGLLHDFAFSRLPVASRALAPMLWLLASEYEGGKISGDFEEVAFKLHMTKGEFCEALNPLIESGFFILDSAALAERKQEAIPEKRDIENIDKTEKNIGRSQKATRPKTSEAFEEFWKAYPRRLGANPKAPAFKKFSAAIGQGADPAAIIEGARRCAVEDHDKIGTPYIPQAVKWLGDQRWADYAAAPPGSSGLSDEERKAMFEKLRKPNEQRAGTDLRGTGSIPREIEGIRGQEPTSHANNQTRNAGMVRLDALFREPLGVRAGSDEAGSVGDEPRIYCAGPIARDV